MHWEQAGGAGQSRLHGLFCQLGLQLHVVMCVFFLIMVKYICNTNVPSLPCLRAEFCGIGHIHIAVWPPPPASPAPFHLPKLSPLSSPPLPSPDTHHSTLSPRIQWLSGPHINGIRQCLSSCDWLISVTHCPQSPPLSQCQNVLPSEG